MLNQFFTTPTHCDKLYIFLSGVICTLTFSSCWRNFLCLAAGGFAWLWC